MSIKDYLHLYLGCQVTTEDGIGEFCGFIPSFDPFTVRPESGILNDAIRVYYDNSVNNEKGAFNFGFYDIAEIKPILRPISNITKEELKVCPIYSSIEHAKRCWETRFLSPTIKPKDVVYLLSKHFDLFGLIDAGLAIDATTMLNSDKNDAVSDTTKVK